MYIKFVFLSSLTSAKTRCPSPWPVNARSMPRNNGPVTDCLNIYLDLDVRAIKSLPTVGNSCDVI